MNEANPLQEEFKMILTKIVLKDPVEHWKRLEEMEQNILYEECCSMNNLRTILNLSIPFKNLSELPKLLQWFSKFPETATTGNPISDDIATCLKKNIDQFKTNPCLPEVIEVIKENHQIYLPKTSNHTNFCKVVVELLSWLPEKYDHRDLANIKECLMNICKNDCKENLGITCFRTMCENLLKTQRLTNPPSSALIIVFQLVDDELWTGSMPVAVKKIISSAEDEEKVVTMLSYFCTWLGHPEASNNMAYLSGWLNLFFKSLELMTDLNKYQHQKIPLRVANVVFPDLLEKCLVLNDFYEIEPEMNIVLHLMTKVGCLRVYHEIMERIFLILKTIKGKHNFTKQLIQSTNIIMKRFDHQHEYCEKCKPVIILSKKWISMNMAESEIKTFSKSKDIREEMEGSFASTSRRNIDKCGLANMGNTCYMNSVLQALVMTQQFCRKVLLYNTTNYDMSDQSVLKNLQNLFALLKYSSKSYLNENQLIHALRPAYFLPGHQQDSSEYLCFLLDILYEQEKAALMQTSSTGSNKSNQNKLKEEEMETDEPIKKSSLHDDGTTGNMSRWITEENLSEGASLERKTQSLADFTQGEVLMQSQNGLSDSHSDSTDSGIQSVGGEDTSSASSTPTLSSSSAYLVQQVFGGELRIIYQCHQCHTESHNTDQFRDLQLCFLENLDPHAAINVQDLINSNYLMPEELTGDNKYRCDKCGGLRDAQRIMKILQAPAHLILTLKHFRYDNQSLLRTKLRRKVIYDDIIKLPVFEQDNETYDLYAAVVHFGDSLDYGHYIAYACDDKGQWYKFNDNWVEETTLEDFKDLESLATPYILFYKKRTDAAEPDLPSFTSLTKSLQDFVEENKLYDNQKLSLRTITNMTSIVPYKGPSNDDDDDNEGNPPSNNFRDSAPLVRW